MPYKGPRKSIRDSKEQRYIWLVCNYGLWGHLPPAPAWEAPYDRWHEWMEDHSRPILKKMKEDGVMSLTTGWRDSNIAGMIHDIQNWDRLKAEGKECKYLV